RIRRAILSRRVSPFDLCRAASRIPLSDRSLLDRFFVILALEDPLHIDSGRMDAIRIELADLDQLFDFSDGDLAGGGDHWVEVARGLAIDEVAPAIALPRFDDREVAVDRVLEDALPAVARDLKDTSLAAVGAHGAGAGGREERWDARAAGAQPLGK